MPLNLPPLLFVFQYPVLGIKQPPHHYVGGLRQASLWRQVLGGQGHYVWKNSW